LPIFGPVLDNFVQWLHEERGYTLATTSAYLNGVPEVVRCLQSRRIADLTELTLQDLRTAHRCFLGRDPAARDAARALEQFLRAEGAVSEGAALNPSSTENEVEGFATYLCEARGLSKVTIREHRKRLRTFLGFLRFDCNPSRLQQLGPGDINAFVCQCARTNSPLSLQHIVVTLRAFLRWRHARGLLAEPLHQQIDTPRVYRGERLPRAIPWEQVQALLASIVREGRGGRRDFTLLYLAAAYGLRSGELVALRLDDIDCKRHAEDHCSG
jgi:site-specific recombinase XerD